MVFHIIRHGETDYNKLGIIQGSGVDMSLNEVGRKQAEAFYKFYRHENYDYIFTSMLKRSIETIVPWKATGIPIYHTEDINEIGWGLHEGKQIEENMTLRYNKLIKDWYSGTLSSRIEGGESAEELFARLNRFIRCLRKLKAQKILVCTHGRSLRALITLLLGLPPEHMERFNHANTGLYAVKLSGHVGELLIENDTRHIDVKSI